MSSTAKPNRFGGIIDAARARQADERQDDPVIVEASLIVTPPRPARRPIAAADVPASLQQPRSGKRSNPEYRHVSAYIRRQTHLAAHQKLLAEGGTRDLSDVIEELVSGWLKS